ncbi:TonB-dependent receptor domain-containing protein [Sphingomonas sp. Leaf23]|uniref:TonB-dependent receptor domain-containing protein n=1 Tax=Sphingomonas sp. Leaf23 TaxID=1735689 RepID=UPI0009E94DB7|nr:TonB-dependent receptor [Sphingomonas sp. Leaf23]
MQSITKLLTTSCLATMLAGTAHAQVVPVEALPETNTASTTSDDDKAIVVTGTRIVRPNNKSAAPIATVTAQEIQAQGATTIEEVLNRLPQVAPNAEQNYAESSGRQRIKLRSLGFERTLTLVDGLRLGIQNGLDVGIIPATLVERIDVLSGGASSVYGSDAVSGVVNFILKKNFDGVEINANYNFYNHQNRENAVTDAARRSFFQAPTGLTNDGARMDVTLTAGKSLLDDRVNLTGFFSYRQADLLPQGSRSWSACEVTTPTRDSALSCTRSQYTQVGTIIPGAGANAGRVLVNNPNGSGNFIPWGSTQGAAANPFDEFAAQRQFNRINAGGFLTVKLSDAAEIYSTLLAYRDRSQNPTPLRVYPASVFGATSYQVNCNNPFLSASQGQTLCGNAAGTNTLVPFNLLYRFDGLPPAYNKFENKGYRVTGGIRGNVFDAWHYDLSGVYSTNTSKLTYPAFPNFDRLRQALIVDNVNGVPTCRTGGASCVPFNPFRPYNNDAAFANYAFENVDGSEVSKPSMWQVLGTVSGDLGTYGIKSPLAEQGVAIALGVEFRAERYIETADALFRQTNGGTDARFTQNIWEGNVEAQLPIVEDRSWTKLLQVNAGYRRSKYNRLAGSFDTWKVEGLWAPVDDITFRGSINKAQAAPTLTQVVSASNINYVTVGSRNDPCATTPDPQNPGRFLAPVASIEACRATGLPDNLYGSQTLSCPDGLCTIRNGGFELAPETAYTKTFGVILRPRFLPGLTVSIDRFLIDLDDQINYFGANDFVNGCIQTQNPYFCRGIVRNPGTYTLYSPATGNPSTGFFIQGTSNGYKSDSHGWDFQSQYALNLDQAGRVDLSFNGTLMTSIGGQDSPTVGARQCVGYYGPFCGEGFPKWTHGLRTTWSSLENVVSLSLNWRYQGPMTITYNATADTGIPYGAADRRTTYNRIRDYNYFDLAATFNVAKRYTLRLAVNNLFDRDPPLIPNSRSLLGLLRNNTLFRYDLLGRQIVAGATVRF